MSGPVDRIARKLVPVIRRGILVGEADSVKLWAVDGEESELWATDLSRESDPDILASEAAGIADEEMSAAGIVRFRIRCMASGEVVSELAFRTGKSTPSPDAVGDSLMRVGETLEKSLARQSMRHAENANRILQTGAERTAGMLVPLVDSLIKANAELTAKYLEQVHKSAEAVKQERVHEIELLRASTEQEAMSEGIKLLREIGPKVAGYFSGENIIAPLVGIVAKLEPEQIALMVQMGQLTKDEGDKLTKAAGKARAAIGDAKALPAKATSPNGAH